MSDIQGLNELIAKYKAMEKDLEPIVTTAVRRQAEVVRGAAVKLCPVNHGELRGSIHTMAKTEDEAIIGVVYTNKDYAPYVEFGTGPVGAANHGGVSPEIQMTYKTEGWWFPVSNPRDAVRYKWPTAVGVDWTIFAHTNGQAAQPFMYPAMKQNEGRVKKGIASYLRNQLQKYCT